MTISRLTRLSHCSKRYPDCGVNKAFVILWHCIDECYYLYFILVNFGTSEPRDLMFSIGYGAVPC